MIEVINNIIYSNLFIMSFYGLTFIIILIIVVATLFVGHPNNIKEIDPYFVNQSQSFSSNQIHNLGVFFNAQRAFSYGMSMLFPNSLGKRVHRNIDISKIPTRLKWPYMLHTTLILMLIPIFLFASIY